MDNVSFGNTNIHFEWSQTLSFHKKKKLFCIGKCVMQNGKYSVLIGSNKKRSIQRLPALNCCCLIYALVLNEFNFLILETLKIDFIIFLNWFNWYG